MRLPPLAVAAAAAAAAKASGSSSDESVLVGVLVEVVVFEDFEWEDFFWLFDEEGREDADEDVDVGRRYDSSVVFDVDVFSCVALVDANDVLVAGVVRFDLDDLTLGDAKKNRFI